MYTLTPGLPMNEFVERLIARAHAHGSFNISVDFDAVPTVHLSPEVTSSPFHPCIARFSTFVSWTSVEISKVCYDHMLSNTFWRIREHIGLPA